MLEDGYGHAPELLIEKMNILKEMLDILEICENDSCRSLTKFISEHDRLPGFVKLVVPAINCMSQEALEF